MLVKISISVSEQISRDRRRTKLNFNLEGDIIIKIVTFPVDGEIVREEVQVLDDRAAN